MGGDWDLSWWPLGAAAAGTLMFAFLFWPVMASERDRPPAIDIDNTATITNPAVIPTKFVGTAERDYISQGAFGEFYTAMVLVSDGWTQLPSKSQGNEGIDGLFVRFDPEKRGVFILIVETKTESAQLAKRQMTKQWILERLDSLAPAFAGPNEKTLSEIREAVKRDSAYVRAERWVHDLQMGSTKRDVLDANAKAMRREALPKTASVQLMKALFVNLDAFDRDGKYIVD